MEQLPSGENNAEKTKNYQVEIVELARKIIGNKGYLPQGKPWTRIELAKLALVRCRASEY